MQRLEAQHRANLGEGKIAMKLANKKMVDRLQTRRAYVFTSILPFQLVKFPPSLFYGEIN